MAKENRQRRADAGKKSGEIGVSQEVMAEGLAWLGIHFLLSAGDVVQERR